MQNFLLSHCPLADDFGEPANPAYLLYVKPSIDMANSGSATSPSSTESWMERFFRFGLIIKGVVYCLVGVIALLAAADLTREKASKTQAFRFIYEQPYGQILLAVVSVGIFGYVLFRFFQSIKDIDHKGQDTGGLFSRIGYGISGIIYLGLGIYAARLLIGGRAYNERSHHFVLKIFSYSWGPWVIGIAGLMIIGNGVYQIYRAISGQFMKRIRVIGSDVENVVKKAGVVGYFSRGIVLIIIGYLVVHSALTSNPTEAQGSERAFTFIENTFGGLLMALIALGLIGYGLFNFVKARFQRIKI
jgi:hypothetical protein